MTVRDRCDVPPPQDTVHVGKSVHAETTQSTGHSLVPQGCVSLNAMEQIQRDKLDNDEPDEMNIRPSDVRFKFGGGSAGEAIRQVDVETDEGPAAGRPVNLNVLNKGPDDNTPALVGISRLKANRVMIDYENDRLCFNDDPRRL